MFERAARTIDRLPLAGKYALMPALKGYIRSGPEREWRKFVGVNALLGIYVVGHTIQAKYGVETFTEHMQNLDSTGNADDALFMALDATYATVNAAVTLRQISLIKRANDIRKWRAKRAHRPSSPPMPAGPTSQEPVVPQETMASVQTERIPTKRRLAAKLGGAGLAMLVTIGGQAAMMTSMDDAATKSYHEQCISSADREITRAAQLNPNSSLDEYRQEWIDYCGAKPNEIWPVAQVSPTPIDDLYSSADIIGM